MYKQNKRTRLGKPKQPFPWIKRKIMIVITACMLGMSNGMNMEDQTIKVNHFQTEQQDKKD